MVEPETVNDCGVDSDSFVVETILRRIADDVSLVIDRPLAIERLSAARVFKRPAGKARPHISFKLAFESGDHVTYGSLLVPLPDAIALACYLMMVPDDAVKQRRSAKDLDRATKDAMVEVDNFIGGATDGALRRIAPATKARGAGCQGVRPDVRPAFPYEEGAPLLVGRATTRVHTFDPFEMILILPVIEGVVSEE
jgi:hypothetical protein